MTPKVWITIGVIAGSTIGGYVPAIWGDSLLSLTSIFGSFAGGLVGLYAGFRASQMFS